jgi:putative flippase GtrA
MTLHFAQPARFLLVGAGGYVVNLLAFAALYALATHTSPPRSSPTSSPTA